MGIMSKLFGGSGSDKADKLRQQAIDAFGAIKTPALADLQVQLDKQVQQGILTPEQAEAKLLSSNAFNDIQTDPNLKGAQMQALTALQNTGTEGGLTAIDKAQLQDITNSQNQEAKGRLGAIQSNARERGVGGSGLELAAELQNEQESANRASQQGTDVAAQAQARALQALVAAGNQGSTMEAAEYGQAANKAAAQNAIDKFNAQTMNATNQGNVNTANEAQAANLAASQGIANANTGISNTNKTYNAAQAQQDFNNQMGKAQGVAGTLNNWANDASAQAKADKAADIGIVSGALNGAAQMGATALGGPVAGAAVSGAGPTAGGSTDPYHLHDGENQFFAGGKVPNYGHESMRRTPADHAEGGPDYGHESMAHDPQCMSDGGYCMMKHGGKVPGKAKVEGDSPENDTVDAKLSPGEVVVPRSAMSDEEEFNNFMSKFAPAPKQHKLETAKPEVKALADLHKRVRSLEGGK